MIVKKKAKLLDPTLILVLAYMILITSIKSSNPWSDLQIGNEVFWWVFQIVFFIIVLRIKSNVVLSVCTKNLLFVKFFFFWNLVCIVRGVFTAENYWEWKNLLATSFVLFLPLLVYLSNSFLALQVIVKTWFKYAIFIYLLLSPFIFGDGVGRFLIPFSFLLLFFPILNSKWKLIAFCITVLVIFSDLTARSNVIKFLVPFIIGLLYYIKFFFTVKIFNTVRLIFLFAPFFLLFLALSGVFNIFKMDEYLGEYTVKANERNKDSDEESLTSDTRTFLYQEVIESALNNDYVLFGRTPARGNDSALFGEHNNLTLKTGKLERFSNEVSILNIFTWLGVVGVILYFLIFMKASYLAINQSSNIFIKLVGLNVSFRWLYGWVEDFSNFDLSNIFLWIMIGMCFSKTFRIMTNDEVLMWIRGIFDKEKPLLKSRRLIPS